MHEWEPRKKHIPNTCRGKLTLRHYIDGQNATWIGSSTRGKFVTFFASIDWSDDGPLISFEHRTSLIKIPQTKLERFGKGKD